MNQKGGVGKTTTTVNLGAGLAELGHSTLIVDLDPQAHATLHLGVDPDGLESSVYDALLDPEASALDAVLELRPKLALLPAEVNLAAAETELASAPDRQRRLESALEPLLDLFDFVLIDCPPSLGLLTLNALAAAQEVVVPMQSHFLALQGVGKLLETVRLVSRGVNESLLVSGVILCMHDENTNHAREVVADLEAFFEEAKTQNVPWRHAKVYRPAVRRNIKLAECPSFGQTIFDYAAWCPGALDYRALAASIAAERIEKSVEPLKETAPTPEVTIRNTSAPSTSAR
ncbi:MAG: ParA family protein [Phycisphaeraceae bacterium]|nr:MAG: ParA family protein [Phycisphaeraceae bacterium]